LDEEKIKALTGREPIKARWCKKDFWQFDPTHKLALCTNHRPEVRGSDHGIWRRLSLIPFNVRFWNPAKENGPDNLRQDQTLPAALAEEAEGILAWCVRGCIEWQQKGLAMPDVVKAATAEYREEEDIFERFVDERCYRNTGRSEKASDLYAAYKSWCEKNGEHPKKQKAFGQLLVEKGFVRDKSSNVIYRGIGLLDADQWDDGRDGT
jgi:putative DNA primase/helicase